MRRVHVMFAHHGVFSYGPQAIRLQNWIGSVLLHIRNTDCAHGLPQHTRAARGWLHTRLQVDLHGHREERGLTLGTWGNAGYFVREAGKDRPFKWQADCEPMHMEGEITGHHPQNISLNQPLCRSSLKCDVVDNTHRDGVTVHSQIILHEIRKDRGHGA